MKIIKILIGFSFLLISDLYGQIKLSEIMGNPDGSEYTDEFIEIYNSGDTTVKLTNFYLVAEDDTSNIVFLTDSVLEAGHYGIILDSDYDTTSGNYEENIPDSISRFTINRANFSSYNISNSSSELIQILSNNYTMIDTHSTNPSYDNGYSDERINFEKDIWESSLNINGTPGFENSTFLLDYDLIVTIENSTYSNDSIFINLSILNYSQKTSSAFDINYCIDTDLDSKMTDETIYTKTITDTIQPLDTLNIMLSIPPYFKGANRVIVELDYSEDEDTTNNIDFAIVNVPLDSNDFIITEFVRAPRDIHSAEYFEILSQCDSPINLMNLQFSDMTGTVPIEDEIIVEKDSFFVFTESVELTESFPDLKNVCVMSNWRSLNNTSDQIFLTDFYDNYIDKVIYTLDWDIPDDYAAELISPKLNNNNKSNWKAVQSGSPGFENFSQLVEYNLIATINDCNYSSDLINFNLTIQNYSQNPSSTFDINYCIDTNLDSNF
ncbi:MAG: lamin tail domain-containing protein, partial [Candidatus Marinimicrobia bacterium]|nr:lamin tail domain-containing protein [Candidatus Neomarinimicrobiota bacterium]